MRFLGPWHTYLGIAQRSNLRVFDFCTEGLARAFLSQGPTPTSCGLGSWAGLPEASVFIK